jgi:peroxiredoxin
VRASEGERAPRFTLVDQEQREVSVPAEGRPTVLVFYRGDW